MAVIMKIEGLVAGQPSALDGKYLVEYDPGKDGKDPDGRPMLAHVVVTDDPAKAKRFESIGDFHAEWTKLDPRQPTRPYDGRPNRPLTAFSVATEPAPEVST